jgi:Cu(I)/Ag(I) efflux system periplasmic protein CusF
MRCGFRCAVLLGMVLAVPAWAQKPADDHSAHRAGAHAPSTSLSEGEIRKIDKQARKITIKHGPLKNLDMPPMTMVFQVKEPAMLDRVKTGDKVRFVAEKAGEQYVVTRLEPAK